MRAVSNFKTANVKLVLFDLSSLIITKASSLCNRYATEIDQDDRTLIALLREHPENTIIVLNKSDIAQSQCQSQGQPLLLDESKLDEIFGREIPRLTISAKTGTGVPELLDTLERTVKRLYVCLRFHVLRFTFYFLLFWGRIFFLLFYLKLFILLRIKLDV